MTLAAGDPFGERSALPLRKRLNVLGAQCDLRSNDRALLALAIDAYGGLPRHRLPGGTCRLDVRLVLNSHAPSWTERTEPPRPTLTAGGGLLCAAIDAANLAVVDAERSRALVCVSRGLLRRPYYARYELIEFALLTLAARAQSLVPLHAACLGRDHDSVLLMGASGTGKSTIALHSLVRGLTFLSEDSAFVAGDDLLVTGTPNYLHLQESALASLSDASLKRKIRSAPVIERRSGARKFELDLRRLQFKRAQTPLRLAATVFLSRRPANGQTPLRPLARAALRERLRCEQPYAAGLPNWRRFERLVAQLPAFELRRTTHPDLAADAIAAVLDGRGTA